MNVRHDKIIKNLYTMFLEYEQYRKEEEKNQKKKKTRRAGKKNKTGQKRN